MSGGRPSWVQKHPFLKSCDVRNAEKHLTVMNQNGESAVIDANQRERECYPSV
jgi:hypothetical protein